MNAIYGALVALLISASSVLAATTEGKIATVDRATMTLTLADGQSYKLSEEFVVEDFTEGMDVTISYDEINGEKIVLQIIAD